MLNSNDFNEKGRIQAKETIKRCIDEDEYLGARGDCFCCWEMDFRNKETSVSEVVKNAP